MSGQIHTPAALPEEKTPAAHWIGAFFERRAGLDILEKREVCSFLGSNPGLSSP
jgi:hypothetical protein